MTEYINRAKFCEYLRTRKAESADDYGRGWKNGIIATEKAARGFPAADVVPVIPVTDDLTMEIYVMVFNALKKAEEHRKDDSRNDSV